MRAVTVVVLVCGAALAGAWLWAHVAKKPSSHEPNARAEPQGNVTHDVLLKPIDILGTDEPDLFSISGIVRRSHSQTQNFFLPKVADATFELIADGLRFEFRAPDGTTIVPGQTKDLPGYQYFSARPGLSAFQLVKPPTGDWIVTATSHGAKDSIPYLITVGSTDLSRERAHLELLVGDSGPATVVDAHPGETVFVRAFLSREGQVVTGANWALRVARPDYAFEPLQVFDDGLHADGEPRDGVAVGSFALDDGPGVYDVVGKGRARSGTTYSVGGSVSVKQLHDLAIESDIRIAPQDPVVGKPVELLVKIANIGRVNDVAVTLHLYVNKEIVATQQLTLDAGSAREVGTTWTPTASGIYDIRLSIDPGGQIRESTYANNSRVTTVSVGDH